MAAVEAAAIRVVVAVAIHKAAAVHPVAAAAAVDPPQPHRPLR
jgi:hypothetical protein